jgi:cupin fold WbuC family metalloprotein
MSVFFFKGQDIITIQEIDLEKLKRAAEDAPLRRARYCLHQSHDDKVQEMVIAYCYDSEIPIHRHRGKTESFHIIEGELELLLFDDGGNITKKIKMGPSGSGMPFMFRMSSEYWHSAKLLTNYVIVHETVAGPFIKEEEEILGIREKGK